MTVSDPDQDDLREALKRVAVALKESGVPFALTGGYAVWARGGPESEHDVDFVIEEEDFQRVREHLAACGLDVREPPEDWLFKVDVGDAFVDVLYRMSSEPTTRGALADVDRLEVLSVEMPVLSATSVVLHKLNALDEHSCDFTAVIPVARALREQVDWERIRAGTADNDFAAALLFLLERLEVVSRG